MLIHIKVLNNPAYAEISLSVSPSDTIQQIKSRIFDQLNISINQQKLVHKGKPLHDGSLESHNIVDGTKLHLMLSIINPPTTTKIINNEFINQLHILASKWISVPNEREVFVTTFQKEMKNIVDRLSLDDIEKLCADRLNSSLA